MITTIARNKRKVPVRTIEICEAASAESGMFRTAVSTAVSHFFAAMLERLEAGESVNVSGFGTFYISKRKAKMHNDVSGTADMVYTPPLDTVRFKPSNKLKKRMWLRSTEKMPEIPDGARLGERIAKVLMNS